jgi:hypothetical protein
MDDVLEVLVKGGVISLGREFHKGKVVGKQVVGKSVTEIM